MNVLSSDGSDWLGQALQSLRAKCALMTAVVVGPVEHPRMGQRALVTFDTSRQMIISGALAECETYWRDDLENIHRTQGAHIIEVELPNAITKATGQEPAQIFFSWCGPPETVWIFGAGHIAQALAPLLGNLGFRVCICDDRAEYVTPERFPDANELHIGEFRSLASQCADSDHAWIVLVTRGHQHDDQILRALKDSHPAYIGMIGSRRRVKTVRERLIAEKLPTDFVNLIRAPIGIPIAADSPSEIAISIAAEIIAVRRGAPITQSSESGPAVTTADTSGIFALWERTAEMLSGGQSAILATIIERRGSTPRGLGAQMAIFANGETAGTIGGGCGEEEIKTAAKRLILGSGPPLTVKVNLTGDPQSETADICGGRYTVFLERLTK